MNEEGTCSSLGGKLTKVCMSGHSLCLVEYEDAGKVCLSSFQCKGECQVSEEKWGESFSFGTCSSSNNPCGCKAGVEFGMVSRGRCLD